MIGKKDRYNEDFSSNCFSFVTVSSRVEISRDREFFGWRRNSR